MLMGDDPGIRPKIRFGGCRQNAWAVAVGSLELE